MKRILPIIVAITAVVVVVIAASSGGSSAKPGKPRAAAVQGAANSAITVRRTAHGSTLVDAAGRTLYLFEADTAGASNCSGACQSVWPALTADRQPQVRGEAVEGEIGSIPGPEGKRQITYASHPLYYYVGDRKPGDTNGQGLNQFGAKWYVLSAAGAKIDDD